MAGNLHGMEVCVDPDYRGLRIGQRLYAERRKLAQSWGLKGIVFARSRLAVEVLTKYLKDVFDHDRRKPPRVLAYRGGYLPTERRNAERKLRKGEVDCVVTDNYGGAMEATRFLLECGHERIGMLAAEEEDLNEELKPYRYYPVVAIGLSFRF